MIVETLPRYTVHSSKSSTKTLLAKLLYLVDFAWYYEHLQPVSGMKYRRLQYRLIAYAVREERVVRVLAFIPSSGNQRW